MEKNSCPVDNRNAPDLMLLHQAFTLAADNHVIGILAQADLALKDKPDRVHKTVAEISKTTRSSITAA